MNALSQTYRPSAEILNSRPDLNARIITLCNTKEPGQGHDGFIEGLNAISPGLTFRHVLTRGNWHRLGGVVDAHYERISDNIVHWAEQESDGDPEQLVLKYLDSAYFATNLAGQTHYYTAVDGDRPEQFLQLEIEELQEVIDRPLVDPDWFPDSLEEFLDPLDYPRLEPEPIGQPKIIFRRLTDIDELIHRTARESSHLKNIRRFFADWSFSSAHHSTNFCDRWILALREYIDRDGEKQINAKPVSTYLEEQEKLSEIIGKRGSELAKAIHHYDHVMGYHFSWFFMMLASKSENFALADAVLRDQMGAYDYLPPRDLKVLREWEARPYSI